VDLDKSASTSIYNDMFSEPQNQHGGNYVAGRSVACVDRLGSGKYGVMVANYGGPMRLFEMLPDSGSRTIQDVAPEAGVDKTTGGRAVVAGPIVSNRMDIFANNEGSENYLFMSDGSGKFRDVAHMAGVLDAARTGRGTALFDENGDGLLDLVYGNWQGPHRLFVQERDSEGCASFADKAPVDMQAPSPIRTVIVADFDNDGHEEIFWNNIPGENRLFRREETGNGGITDWTQVNIGDALEADGYGTGAAIGDFDGDGRLELVIAHGESASQPLSYFRPRKGADNHWIRVLPKTQFGAPARGAVVKLHAGGRVQVRLIDAGSGYLCQMEPVAHFGLGKVATVDEIVITWPDGAEHSIKSPAIDQLVEVQRPAGLDPHPFVGNCMLPPTLSSSSTSMPPPTLASSSTSKPPPGLTSSSTSMPPPTLTSSSTSMPAPTLMSSSTSKPPPALRSSSTSIPPLTPSSASNSIVSRVFLFLTMLLSALPIM